VSARDAADSIGHGEHRKAERKRDTEKSDAELGKAGCKDRAAAASKDKPKRTKKFREQLFGHERLLV
jgi:hypothetical protein